MESKFSSEVFSDVAQRIARKNQILFSRDSTCLKELLGLMAQQDHRTLILWALDCARGPVKTIEARCPDEKRPSHCIERCSAWAKGEIKMPEAKRAILAAHQAAKELDDAVCAALCHAVGQAGAAVHTPRHAPGLPIYELTAVVLEQKGEHYEELVLTKIRYYIERLAYWQSKASLDERQWAGFLMKGKVSVQDKS